MPFIISLYTSTYERILTTGKYLPINEVIVMKQNMEYGVMKYVSLLVKTLKIER